MKIRDLNMIIENTLSEEIRKTIISENQKGKKVVYHVKCEGEPIASFPNEEEALGYMKKVKDEISGKPMIIEKEVYESYSDMIEKLDQIGQELEEKENQNMENQNMENKETMEGNPFAYAALMAKKEGKKKFKFGGKTHDVEESYNQFDELDNVEEGQWDEEGECNECGQKSMEEDFGEDPETIGKIKSLYNKLHSDSQMEEDLSGDQHKLDVDKDGDIGADDLADLRSGKEGDVNEGIPLFLPAIIKGLRDELGREPSDEEVGKEVKKMFSKHQDDKKDDKKKKEKDVNEGHGTCNECGSMLNEEGMCQECGTMKESKKKTLKLTETEMVEMIRSIVNETVPGLDIAKKSSGGSGKDSKEYLSSVEKKMKDMLSFDGNDNPEFPKQIGKGEKEARHNSKEEDEVVADARGGGLEDLNYSVEPSEKFKKRLKMALEGDVTMGNSQDAANVVKSDLGKKIGDKVERKKKKEKAEDTVSWGHRWKEPQDVNVVKKESKIELSSLLNEEIQKMKNITNYNKKTQ